MNPCYLQAGLATRPLHCQHTPTIVAAQHRLSRLFPDSPGIKRLELRHRAKFTNIELYSKCRLPKNARRAKHGTERIVGGDGLTRSSPLSRCFFVSFVQPLCGWDLLDWLRCFRTDIGLAGESFSPGTNKLAECRQQSSCHLRCTGQAA